MNQGTMLRIAVLSACSCMALAAGAQAAGHTCGLDRRNLKDVPVPSVADGDLDGRTATDLQQAFTLLTTPGRVELAGPLFARTLARSSADNNLCAQALAQFGLAEWQAGDSLAAAQSSARSAQALFAQVGTPLAQAIVAERLALLDYLSGNTAALRAQAPGLEENLREAGDPASAIRLHSLALQYEQNGQKPEEHAALAHELEGLHTENVTAVRGYVEWAWGSSLRRVGRYAEIEAHFQAALAAFAQCACDPATHAALLLNLATVADANGNAETILRYAGEADDIYRQYRLTALRSQSMRLLAAGYARQQNWPKAIAEYNAGLDLAAKTGALAAVPNLKIELAATYGNSGNPRSGLDALHSLPEKSLTPMQRCASVAQEVQLDDQAADFAGTLDIARTSPEGCDGLLQPGTSAAVEAALADAHMHRGNTADAVTHARRAVALLDTQRPRVRNSDAAQIEYNEHQSAIYTVLVRALLAAGLPEDALLASEQGRTRAFIDLAQTPRTPPNPSAAAPLLPSPRSAGRARDLPSQTHAFAMTAAELHSVLDWQHSTLVAYWLGSDRLFTWVAAPGKPVVALERPITPLQLAALVRASLPANTSGQSRGTQMRTRGGASQSVLPRSRKPWSDLYTLLIAPISSLLPPEEGALLTIVPQGPLFQVSFPALLDAHGRYLIERYALHETPSIAVLQLAEKNSADHALTPPHYVVVANPEVLPSVNGVPLPPLPGTAEEAHSIQQLAPAATMLEGKLAGIDTLKSALPSATVLHFATHSVVSDDAPSTSFLALDARQGGGRLTTASVYGLHLQTQLVVLSACRSGRGRITGDGVQGFTRAFFYAGSASLVTTLWDVVDAPTARLVPTLYAGLVQGAPVSTALRDAQLRLIQDLRAGRVRVPTLGGTTVRLHEDPAYWAAFSLSGKP